jgi:hypothetical protein
VAARDLTARQAVARLEERGGQLQVHARVREGGAFFSTNDIATYACVGRDNGATVVVGPNGNRWLLGTDADRASLAADLTRVRNDRNANAAGPGIVYVFGHRDELQTDGGYGQVGCFLAILSTAVGLVLGIAVAWLLYGSFNASAALVGSVVGLVTAMSTADWVGSVLAGVPALRDRVITLVNVFVLVVPGLITFLIIVIASGASV